MDVRVLPLGTKGTSFPHSSDTSTLSATTMGESTLSSGLPHGKSRRAYATGARSAVKLDVCARPLSHEDTSSGCML
eukprot:COSAG02_NODE_11404_length_1730_cov_1.623544_1_plen_75_part_10